MKFITNHIGIIVIVVAIIAIIALVGNRKNAKILSDNGLEAKDSSTNSKKE